MINVILLNFIFLLVPMVIYMLYNVFENVIGENGKEIFFSLSIITSMYLISKYSYYFNYSKDIINILFLISILKNKKVLSSLIFIYLVMIDFNYIYLIIYLLKISLLFVNIKNVFKVIIFSILGIIGGFILSDAVNYILISNTCYGICSYIFVYLIKKSEDVIGVYGTIKDVEYEKSLRESMFKITHEVKNPIAVIKGYLDMMDVNNSKQVSKYIPIIKEETDRTIMLMNDFLNLTKLKVNKSTMDLSLLLDDIYDEVNALLIGKDIKFILNNSYEELFMVGDYDRLKQVFINIIKNSIESININGIINLDIVVNKNNIIILIKDNGIGMSKEVLERIGESFFTTKKKGTGLGVKFSKEIINEHKGSIKYSSKLGNGTLVKIILPRKK